MESTRLIAIIAVLIGACFIWVSIKSARKSKNRISGILAKKWMTLIALMYFFFAGYLFFDLILGASIPFPLELVTGFLFLAGAIFVFIVIQLVQQSFDWFLEAEKKLKDLNETLEMRVNERTSELTDSQEFTKIVLDNLQDSIAMINVEDYSIVSANRAFLDEFDQELGDIVGRTCFEVTHQRQTPCEPPYDTCPLVTTLENGTHEVVEHIHFAKDGKKIIAEVHTIPIKQKDGKIRQVVHLSRNITLRRQHEEKIRSLAFFDVLTGLPNRTLYKELLDQALAQGKRNSRNLAVLFIDLDSFKKINDTLGHSHGDELLKQFARRLTTCLRSSDYIARSGSEDQQISTVSRLGGDEFIVLLHEIGYPRDAGVVSQRILDDLAKPFLLGQHEVSITASIGIALFPKDSLDAESLLKNADMAMYEAKKLGKNRYQFYSEEMNRDALERLQMENDMRKALTANEFVVYMQPMIDIATGTITGAEALVRWIHPVNGLIPPLNFIPIAEETGFIVALGRWVLLHACQQIQRIRQLFDADLRVAVNISIRQFLHGDFVEMVESVLRESGLPPKALELEITESTIMHNPNQTITILQTLKKLGITAAIDDFGTGYSSLDHLKKLPVDSLKIDRVFVKNITTEKQDAAIIRAVIAMAKTLDLKIVAEGVETDEQLQFLLDLKCDLGQGYLFSKPLPIPDFESLLQNKNS